MPEWVIERGIGETRAALIDGGEIREARILVDGVVEAGKRVAARLVSSGRNGVARAEDGAEYLLPKGAPGLSEGAATTIEVTRSAIPGPETWKRPLARIAFDQGGAEQLEGRL
ncbi:MAG TPA: ribonuclease, partial [Sphingomicrobium sp.]